MHPIGIPGKKTPGGAGTHTGHTRDTRAHNGTRITPVAPVLGGPVSVRVVLNRFSSRRCIHVRADDDALEVYDGPVSWVSNSKHWL